MRGLQDTKHMSLIYAIGFHIFWERAIIGCGGYNIISRCLFGSTYSFFKEIILKISIILLDNLWRWRIITAKNVHVIYLLLC